MNFGHFASGTLALVFIAGCSEAMDSTLSPETVGKTEQALCQPFQSGLVDHVRTFADVNGDGADDYCRFIGGHDAPILSCMLGSKSGKFSEQNAFKSMPVDPGRPELPRLFGDVNGDKKADYCRFVGQAPALTLSCLIAGENGFDSAIAFNSLSGFDPGDAGQPQALIDVNNDQRADYCRIVGTGTSARAACALSMGGGFGAQFGYTSALGLSVGNNTRPRAFLDINGDRFVDYCRFVNTAAAPLGERACTLGGATGFGPNLGYRDSASPFRIEDTEDTACSSRVAAEENVMVGAAAFVHVDPAFGQSSYCEDWNWESTPGTTVMCRAAASDGFKFPTYPGCGIKEYSPGDAGLPRAFVNVSDSYVALNNGRKGFPDFCRFVSGYLNCVIESPYLLTYYNQTYDRHSGVGPGLATYPREFADVNGDGLMDYCRFLEDGIGGRYPSCALGAADSFALFSQEMSGRSTPETCVSAPVVTFRAHANGKLVTAENAGGSPLIANRTVIGPWEKFDELDLGNGNIALRAHANGKYVAAENAGGSPLIANRSAVGPWETFQLIHNADGSVTLRAQVNGKYVATENAGASSLIANRSAIGPWEKLYRIVN